MHSEGNNLAHNHNGGAYPPSRLEHLLLTEHWSEQSATELLRAYIDLIRPWRYWIAFVTVLVTALTYVIVHFVVLHYFRAVAIIEVSSQSGQSGGMSGLGSLGGLAALGGLRDPGEQKASEYQSIMESYAFTVNLVEKNHLVPELLKSGVLPSNVPRAEITEYTVYGKMRSLLHCDYDSKSENLTIYFLYPDKLKAEHILGLYLTQLRELLRNREIASTTAAIDALRRQAEATPDPMLQSQLYELLASQIQGRSLATVEADFAFTVIEPPISSDRYYKPHAGVFCLAALLATPLLFGALIILHARILVPLQGPLPKPYQPQIEDARVESEAPTQRLPG